MAAPYTVQYAKHATLASIDVAETVTLSGVRPGVVRVRNRGTSGDPVYFRIYSPGSNSPPAAPTAGADDTYIVPFGEAVDIAWSLSTCRVVVISHTAQPYSVESISGLN